MRPYGVKLMQYLTSGERMCKPTGAKHTRCSAMSVPALQQNVTFGGTTLQTSSLAKLQWLRKHRLKGGAGGRRLPHATASPSVHLFDNPTTPRPHFAVLGEEGKGHFHLPHPLCEGVPTPRHATPRELRPKIISHFPNCTEIHWRVRVRVRCPPSSGGVTQSTEIHWRVRVRMRSPPSSGGVSQSTDL